MSITVEKKINVTEEQEKRIAKKANEFVETFQTEFLKKCGFRVYMDLINDMLKKLKWTLTNLK